MLILCYYKLIFEKENIIKYERAFGLPSGQTCIVMELAVNDLHTQLKARQNGKRRSYLPLQCIRSIGQQALSGLVYLHGEGFMHRDLKPQNILVTKWDAQTDIPTIKLGDFGLAGISSKAKTICGTEGYVAPEVIRANLRAKELQKQKKKGMKAVSENRWLTYTNAIDIWALGKILKDLVKDVPSVLRGKTVNKNPALRLIDRMMQDDPDLRPTAAECLQDPWMATNNNSNSMLAQKRSRSLTPGPLSPKSSAKQPLRKVIRMAFGSSVTTEEGSTAAIIKAIWPGELSDPDGFSQNLHGVRIPSDIEKKDRSSDRRLLHDHPQTTQLTIQFGDDGRLSLTARGYNDALMLDFPVAQDKKHPPAILADNAIPYGASFLMQDVACRLLAALQVEGYGNDVTIEGHNADIGVIHNEISRLSISSIQLRQQSHSSVMLGLEFDDEEWTRNFWNEAQPSVNHNIELQSAGPVNRNNTAAADDNSNPRSDLQVLFSQVPAPSFVDEPMFQQQEAVGALHQYSVPTITYNDHAITDKSFGTAQSSVVSSGSDSRLSKEANKGVTYPSCLEDDMACVSF